MTSPRPAPPNRSRCLKPAVAGLLTVAVACGPSGISTSGAESTGRLRSADSEALFAPIGPDDPGCSAAVNVDGQIVWSAAYGRASLERDEPFTPETLVDIGSTSKQFTATALGLLIDDGTISWDDSVSDHLNKLPDWSAQVTIDDLAARGLLEPARRGDRPEDPGTRIDTWTGGRLDRALREVRGA